MYKDIQNIIDSFRFSTIPKERKEILDLLIHYLQEKMDKKEPIHLNFICTHNSRRSQFAQLWAQVAADHFAVPVHTYSGGVEVTEFNPRAIKSLQRFGFNVESKGEVNPHYFIKWSPSKSLEMFSKTYDDSFNTSSKFCAIMTCSHADENCPLIHGCDERIPVRYEDPKIFDNTNQESEKYDERSNEIGQEMFYVFSQVK